MTEAHKYLLNRMARIIADYEAQIAQLIGVIEVRDRELAALRAEKSESAPGGEGTS